jgi:hypothetical protein
MRPGSEPEEGAALPLFTSVDAVCVTRRPRPPRLIWPPFRPALRASSGVHSCAVPFSWAARPPLLAISRCFSGDIDANPRRSFRTPSTAFLLAFGRQRHCTKARCPRQHMDRRAQVPKVAPEPARAAGRWAVCPACHPVLDPAGGRDCVPAYRGFGLAVRSPSLARLGFKRHAGRDRKMHTIKSFQSWCLRPLPKVRHRFL